MNTYILNIITEKKMDGKGNIVLNGRVLNKYPIYLKCSCVLEEHTLFLRNIWKEYLSTLDEDTLGRTYLYIRSFTPEPETTRIPVNNYINKMKESC